MKKFFLMLVLGIFTVTTLAQDKELSNYDEQYQLAAQKKMEEVLQMKQNDSKYQIDTRDTRWQSDVNRKTRAPQDATIWEDDLEGDVSGWTFVDLTLQDSHIRTLDVGGDLAWWCGEMYGELPGYDNSWIQYLTTTAAHEVPSGATAELVYDIKWGSEEGFDYTTLLVSTDGETWTALKAYDGESDWTTDTVDVSAYAGSSIWIRFAFTADGGYSQADGLVTYEGAFWLDNLNLVVNGTATLIDDAGDTVTGLESGVADPVGNDWHVTDATSNSPTHSILNSDPTSGTYSPSQISAVVSPEIDLTTVDAWANVYADFYIQAIGMEYEGSNYDYWKVEATSDGGATWANIMPYIYVGDWGGADSFDLFGESNSTGVPDLTPYVGNVIQLRWVFIANDNDVVGRGVAIDDPIVYMAADPNEPNNLFGEATPIEYGYVTPSGVDLNPPTDVDVYKFAGMEDDWVDINVSNAEVDLQLQIIYTPESGGGLYYYTIIDGVEEDRFFDQLPKTYANDAYGLADNEFLLRIRAADPTDANPEPDSVGPYMMYIEHLMPEPEITKAADVPNDQGKFVRLQWNPSDFDARGIFPELKVSHYTIWRKVLGSFRDWDYVGDFPAVVGEYDKYSVVVPTTEDGKDFTFRVAAHAPGDMFFWSENYMGQSEDNLAPEFMDANGNVTVDGVVLAWDVDAPDLVGLKIHRSMESGFEPAATNVVGSVLGTEVDYLDETAEGGKHYYYVLAAYDDGGNVTYSNEIDMDLTSVNDNAVPTEFGLDQNYPNPFNPSTTISFALPQEAKVTLSVYNVLGEEVAKLVNSTLSAGYHTVDFNAVNLITGAYIYKIQATGIDGDEFTQIRKMMLLK